jgi:hypothetical protein
MGKVGEKRSPWKGMGLAPKVKAPRRQKRSTAALRSEWHLRLLPRRPAGRFTGGAGTLTGNDTPVRHAPVRVDFHREPTGIKLYLDVEDLYVYTALDPRRLRGQRDATLG